MKFSVVIPTLWRSKRIHTLLENLIRCEGVGEILLIDNNRKFNEFYKKLDKVRVLSPHFNIYVNPSWNYGVKFSSNQYVVLLNDDVSFDTNILTHLSNEDLKKYGFIGMHSENYTKRCVGLPTIEPWVGQTFDGWGCMIVFDKSHWIPIPEEMKIWCGDNFIREANPSPKSVLSNFSIKTDMSTTSKEVRWDEIKKNDLEYYLKHIKRD